MPLTQITKWNEQNETKVIAELFTRIEYNYITRHKAEDKFGCGKHQGQISRLQGAKYYRNRRVGKELGSNLKIPRYLWINVTPAA